ncbi:MAG: hypothetical protein ACM3O9_05205 [Methylocystaceae bacterium]
MANSRCETCSMRLYAEKNPQTFKAKLWRWHTKICPGWKQYQRSLNNPERPNPK